MIYLAFANTSSNPLKSLSEEEDKILDALRPRERSGHFMIKHDSFATIEKLSKNLAEFKDHLMIFHYSGHAGDNELELDEGDAKAGGLVSFLGNCPKLKLVVLNGCSTKGQVRRLLEGGVPAVIATHAPVQDSSAKQFAISFYNALANTEDFMAAFKEGISGAKFVKDGIEPRRGIKLHDDYDDPGELWGLFGEDEAVAEKLPTNHYDKTAEDFEPNSKLIDALVRGMNFLPEFQQMLDTEESGIEVQVYQKREKILTELPKPISEPLRKLMLPSLDEDRDHYDRKTPERIRQMLLLHEIMISCLTYMILSELWDARMAREELSMPAQTQEAIITFMRKGFRDRNAKDYLKTAGLILDFLLDKKSSCYIQELEKLTGIFAEDHPFYQASNFLMGIKEKGDPQSFDPGEVEYFALEGETRLSLIMEQLSFLARYNIVSVIGIDVIKNRSLPRASFVHRMVTLVERIGGLGEEPRVLDEVMETNSVLIIRKENMNGKHEESTQKPFLNLTPFVIDENAFFKEKATKTRLYFFDRMEREKEQIYYWCIYNPDSTLDTGEKQYGVLRAQFKAFFKLFFNEPEHENTV